ncbi:MAG: YaaC family protein [Nitrolancea sp.]
MQQTTLVFWNFPFAVNLQERIGPLSDIWELLATFESRDVVSRLYAERHGRNLKKGKALEIISHMAQGREYFDSARQAGDLVRPLLIYYGVLSLSRGVILFIRDDRRESGLKESHGLREVAWGQELAKGIQAIPALQIELNSGTFTELVRSTGNCEVYYAVSGSFGEWVPIVGSLGTSDKLVGKVVRLGDVLARIPDLDTIYQQTLRGPRQVFPVVVQISWDQNHEPIVAVSALSTDDKLPDPTELKDIFELSEQTSIQVKDGNTDFALVPNVELGFHFTNIEQMAVGLPPILMDRSHQSFLSAPLPGSMSLNSLALLFIASYATGMLVRYFPTSWMSLIARETGDVALPLIKTISAMVEQRYPLLVLQELEHQRQPGFGSTMSTRIAPDISY